jgi:hypothetical protein
VDCPFILVWNETLFFYLHVSAMSVRVRVHVCCCCFRILCGNFYGKCNHINLHDHFLSGYMCASLCVCVIAKKKTNITFTVQTAFVLRVERKCTADGEFAAGS